MTNELPPAKKNDMLLFYCYESSIKRFIKKVRDELENHKNSISRSLCVTKYNDYVSSYTIFKSLHEDTRKIEKDLLDKNESLYSENTNDPIVDEIKKLYTQKNKSIDLQQKIFKLAKFFEKPENLLLINDFPSSLKSYISIASYFINK